MMMMMIKLIKYHDLQCNIKIQGRRIVDVKIIVALLPWYVSERAITQVLKIGRIVEKSGSSVLENRVSSNIRSICTMNSHGTLSRHNPRAINGRACTRLRDECISVLPRTFGVSSIARERRSIRPRHIASRGSVLLCGATGRPRGHCYHLWLNLSPGWR